MINKGYWLPEGQISKFEGYKRAVNKETKKWTKTLFSQWNGRCYYNGEPLMDTDGNNYRGKYKPTIDHKISIFHGFSKKISSEIIGHINNLVVCSSRMNSIKNVLTEEEFFKSNRSKEIHWDRFDFSTGRYYAR